LRVGTPTRTKTLADFFGARFPRDDWFDAGEPEEEAGQSR